jgi:calmodulin
MITPKELAGVMGALGQHPSKVDLSNIIASADGDSKGTVTFSEFLTIIAPRMDDEISNQAICDAFEVLDEEVRFPLYHLFFFFSTQNPHCSPLLFVHVLQGKGYVDAQKVRHMWSTMGERLTEQEISDTFKAHNIDPEGTISFKQFTEMMLTPS